MSSQPRNGFTLIEIATVLVIIGLIIGGIMVGQDMMNAAAIRGQISQIEKFTAAVHTFQSKYNCLPGDCANAADYGFPPRGQYAGQGDGNGIIEGVSGNTPNANSGWYETTGESVLFWDDLSKAGLIEGGFTTGSATNTGVGITTVSLYLPGARIGNGNCVAAWSGGPAGTDKTNYFGLTAINVLNWGTPGFSDGLSVSEAANIDTKMDDGFPQSGTVTIAIFNVNAGTFSANIKHGWPTSAISQFGLTPSSTTCVDNGGITGVPIHYSTEINGGANVNCSLSFRFQ